MLNKKRSWQIDKITQTKWKNSPVKLLYLVYMTTVESHDFSSELDEYACK